jgi:hypothetical protein
LVSMWRHITESMITGNASNPRVSRVVEVTPRPVTPLTALQQSDVCYMWVLSAVRSGETTI